MYSKEFMKFLYGYQKDDFKPENKEIKIKLKSGGSGKPAKVYVTNDRN